MLCPFKTHLITKAIRHVCLTCDLSARDNGVLLSTWALHLGSKCPLDNDLNVNMKVDFSNKATLK